MWQIHEIWSSGVTRERYSCPKIAAILINYGSWLKKTSSDMPQRGASWRWCRKTDHCGPFQKTVFEVPMKAVFLALIGCKNHAGNMLVLLSKSDTHCMCCGGWSSHFNAPECGKGANCTYCTYSFSGTVSQIKSAASASVFHHIQEQTAAVNCSSYTVKPASYFNSYTLSNMYLKNYLSCVYSYFYVILEHKQFMVIQL